MIAILMWAAVILWCGAVLFLVSLPFLFGVMFLAGKGALAKKWWAAIKPRCKPNDAVFEHTNYMFDSRFSSLECNVFNQSKYHR